MWSNGHMLDRFVVLRLKEYLYKHDGEVDEPKRIIGLKYNVVKFSKTRRIFFNDYLNCLEEFTHDDKNS